MRKLELTKEGKLALAGMVIVILGVILFFAFRNKVSSLYLNTEILDFGDQIEYKGEETVIRMHMGSSIQLTYDIEPKNIKANIEFNKYDKDVVSINSTGLLRAKKVGKTTLQLKNRNTLSNKVTIYVY